MATSNFIVSIEDEVIFMNMKIMIGILVSLIIGGSIGYGISYPIISEMRSEISMLQTRYHDLNLTYHNYVATHSHSNSEYDSLYRDYQRLQTWLNGNLSLIDSLNSTYNELRIAYEKLQVDYDILKSAGLVFDGLKISNIKKEKEASGRYSVLGNITNVSNRSMNKVYIILFVYNRDGSLDHYSINIIESLAVNETVRFEFQEDLEEDQTFKVIAVGNYGFSDIENSKIAELLAEIDTLNSKIQELEEKLNYEVHVLVDQIYYYSVRYNLHNANSSIIVVMYSMVYDPDDLFDWANDLIRELVNAEKRGVNVTVIIEYRTYYGYMDRNLEAYNYLLSNGVNVKLDYEPDTDHLKLVIIDGKIVYVGSHNWSEASLYYNHETSVEIISEEIAQIFLQYIIENY